MTNKLKYYVWLLGEDVEESITKVMNEYASDVADACRIFDCDYEAIRNLLRSEVSEKES